MGWGRWEGEEERGRRTLMPSLINISVALASFFFSLTVRPLYGATAAVKNIRFRLVLSSPLNRAGCSSGNDDNDSGEGEDSGFSGCSGLGAFVDGAMGGKRWERTVADARAVASGRGREESVEERCGGKKKIEAWREREEMMRKERRGKRPDPQRQQRRKTRPRISSRLSLFLRPDSFPEKLKRKRGR
jgi:hypothetical protein